MSDPRKHDGDDDQVEEPDDSSPDFAEPEAPPATPQDVDRGRALEAEAHAKEARS